jgi:hypothetical protein
MNNYELIGLFLIIPAMMLTIVGQPYVGLIYALLAIVCFLKGAG